MLMLMLPSALVLLLFFEPLLFLGPEGYFQLRLGSRRFLVAISEEDDELLAKIECGSDMDDSFPQESSTSVVGVPWTLFVVFRNECRWNEWELLFRCMVFPGVRKDELDFVLDFGIPCLCKCCCCCCEVRSIVPLSLSFSTAG